jgi:clan AA aspartic protease (TIGR02281 family)
MKSRPLVRLFVHAHIHESPKGQPSFGWQRTGDNRQLFSKRCVFASLRAIFLLRIFVSLRASTRNITRQLNRTLTPEQRIAGSGQRFFRLCTLLLFCVNLRHVRATFQNITPHIPLLSLRLCALLLLAFAPLRDLYSQNYPANAQTYIEQGQYTDAVEVLEKNLAQLKSDTALVEQFNWLANLYLLQNNWQGMVNMYKGYHFSPGEDTSLLSAARFYLANSKQEMSVDENNLKAIPFKPSKSGTPMIDVVINGKKYRFWVDTGAGLTVVSSEVAKKCGVKQLSQKGGNATAATGMQVSIDYGLIDNLQAGNINVKNHPCLVLDKKDLEFRLLGIRIVKIDGIIGWNFLQELGVSIDFVNRWIQFEPSQGKPGSDVNFFWMEQPYVKCVLNGKVNSIFFIDTGANTSGIYTSIYAKVDTSGSKYKTIGIGSAGGKIKMRSLTLPKLDVKIKTREIFMKNVTTEPAFEAKGYFVPDGVLGIKDLKLYVLRFDLKQGNFEVEVGVKR